MSKGCGKMCFACSWIPKEEYVFVLFKVLTAHEVTHEYLVDPRLGFEVEGVECLYYGKLSGLDATFSCTLFALEGFPFDELQ